jgi:hypothetical protein
MPRKTSPFKTPEIVEPTPDAVQQPVTYEYPPRVPHNMDAENRARALEYALQLNEGITTASSKLVEDAKIIEAYLYPQKP